jgi:hypothetical protein
MLRCAIDVAVFEQIAIEWNASFRWDGESHGGVGFVGSGQHRSVAFGIEPTEHKEQGSTYELLSGLQPFPKTAFIWHNNGNNNILNGAERAVIAQ